MKNDHRNSANDVWLLAWSQPRHSSRLSPKWRRRLSTFIGGFKALLWSWS